MNFKIKATWQLELLALVSLSMYSQKTFALGIFHVKPFEFEPIAGHQKIVPILRHGRYGHVLNHTKHYDGTHIKEVTLQFDRNEEPQHIDLFINSNLLPETYFVGYQAPNKPGPYLVQKNYTKSSLDLCHYLGTIRGRPLSRVAISTCDGLSGIIMDGPEMSFIEAPPVTVNVGDEHLLHSYSFPASSIKKEMSSFRIKRDLPVPQRPVYVHGLRFYIELLLVVDYQIYLNHERNLTSVQNYCKKLTNLINVFYRQFDIFVVLTGVVVWTEENKIPMSKDSSITLDKFTNYYLDNMMWDWQPKVDNVKLLIDYEFDNSHVGKAYVDTMCGGSSHGLISVHDRSILKVASTVAHEIGHNLGLHDEDASCNCVMSGSGFNMDKHPIRWTNKNVRHVKEKLLDGSYRCLRNKPKSLFEPPTCGNEFVENGEECDCGPTQYCTERCCHAATCKYRAIPECAGLTSNSKAVFISNFVLGAVILSLCY